MRAHVGSHHRDYRWGGWLGSHLQAVSRNQVREISTTTPSPYPPPKSHPDPVHATLLLTQSCHPRNSELDGTTAGLWDDQTMYGIIDDEDDVQYSLLDQLESFRTVEGIFEFQVRCSPRPLKLNNIGEIYSSSQPVTTTLNGGMLPEQPVCIYDQLSSPPTYSSTPLTTTTIPHLPKTSRRCAGPTPGLASARTGCRSSIR
jgi:hypothetical protein